MTMAAEIKNRMASTPSAAKVHSMLSLQFECIMPLISCVAGGEQNKHHGDQYGCCVQQRYAKGSCGGPTPPGTAYF